MRVANAFRFELSKVTVPAIREHVVASLANVSPAHGWPRTLAWPCPRRCPGALETPAEPEVTASPALSLLARPGEGGIRTRKVAILIADGVEGSSIGKLVSMLVAQGAVPRLVAARLGTCTAEGGEKLEADATMENSPGFLFDALVLPDGVAGVEALDADAHTLEFLRNVFWHCKPILALGASEALLAEASVPLALPDGTADAALILADAADVESAAADFIAALGLPRKFTRENNLPI